MNKIIFVVFLLFASTLALSLKLERPPTISYTIKSANLPTEAIQSITKITWDSSNLLFKGCNSHITRYEVKQTNKITFNPFVSTQKNICSNDHGN